MDYPNFNIKLSQRTFYKKKKVQAKDSIHGDESFKTETTAKLSTIIIYSH